MAIHHFLATRLLCGYSGTDKYINLNANAEVNRLYHDIADGTIQSVNDSVITVDAASSIVRFNIRDNLIGKDYPMHIKKQADGLRFTLTEYVKDTKMTPGQVVRLCINFNGNNCEVFILSSVVYRYILQKHRSENVYRILIDNPRNTLANPITITNSTDQYLLHFGIVNTNERIHSWSGQLCDGYITNTFRKKYIGVPYSTEEGMECDEFNRVEEIQ